MIYNDIGPMANALGISGLHKSFRAGFLLRKKKILKGISIEVRQGEIFGYLGPNGAGKTTTIKCILGLIFPDEGDIRVLGRPHLSLQAKEEIGFLPENPCFHDYLTAAEFLRYSLRLFRGTGGDSEKKIHDLLSLVGLESSAGVRLRKFSRGMLQRVGLAQALLNDPRLLLLDEPLGGLDPLGRKEVRDIIARLKGEGKTVFLSSHILQDIEMICDRVAVLVGGRIISQGELQTLISEKVLFTEILLSGVEERELEPLGESLSTQGGRILLKVPDGDKVDRVLKLVDSLGGKIHSLVPRTETLEDLFVGMVKSE